ncbi:PREDICTED: uncharacterized protein LOC108775423, partial [Cyphomyrmex costatus]|uniref:uncharacterized protein LOC108775423 n=1 Tax=Cyphomyrmex costatus TaxID=456900 RepID=UPI0008521E9B
LTLNKKDIHPRISRWALELQNYDYEVVHRAGTQMQHVDALSRVTSIMVVEDNSLEFNLAACQNEDPVIKELKTTLEKTESKREGLLHSIDKGTLPFDVIHIDHYGPVDKRHKIKQYILTVIDGFTKYVKLYATKTTSSAEEFQNFLKDHNIKHVLVATGSPQANGQVERVHRTLTPMLAKLTENRDGKYWYHVLSDVEFTFNNTANKSTGEAP